MDVLVEYRPSRNSSETLLSSNNSTPPFSSPMEQCEKRLPAARTPSAENSGEPKKRIRKGHRKSRTGCFTCKRVKIKCKENRPDCDYCAHRGLKCEWPESLTKQDSMVMAPRTVKERMPYRFHSDVSSFTLQDFRLFNHFIQCAYPHHPFGNDSVWKHEIPCLASNYDYLLHSMLALAASDLAFTDNCPHQMHNTALSHRVKSITSLNAAIQRGVNCLEEGNAMLATCFSLLFQSTNIDDGLVEYMTFFRGTNVIGSQMGFKRIRFLFDQLLRPEDPGQRKAIDKDAALIQPHVVFGAYESFEKFQHLCQTKLESEVFAVLFNIAHCLITSPGYAYSELRKMYKLFSCSMSHDEFRYYCDPNNHVCKILQAHFVALQLIMDPIAKKEQSLKAASCPVQREKRAATAGWLVGLHRDIPLHLLKYYTWTMWVEREVSRGRIFDLSDAEISQFEISHSCQYLRKSAYPSEHQPLTLSTSLNVIS